MSICAKCNKTAAAAGLPNLKACAKCKTTQYCSRDWQKADWKVHKKNCGANASSRMFDANVPAGRLKDLEAHIPNPFTKLDQGKYLYDRPEKDVYKLLIDSFRIRQEDDLTFEHKTTPGSIYAGESSSIAPFRVYLDKAATRKLLPPWWDAEKRNECEAFGEGGAWNNLRKSVTKHDIVNHYGDPRAPMQLRMLAEAVYGVGSMGQNGSRMRKQMALMESGGPGSDDFVSMLGSLV
ncbi:hypothetical protein ACEQ8H_002393 [Pleosporales sp. CAS-2024a]